MLGAWLVVAAVAVFETVPAHFWNDVIVGAAIFAVAGYTFASGGEYEPVNAASALLLPLLGLWEIIAALNFLRLGGAMFWNDVIVGALVVVLGVYDVYLGRVVTLEDEAEEADYAQ